MKSGVNMVGEARKQKRTQVPALEKFLQMIFILIVLFIINISGKNYSQDVF